MRIAGIILPIYAHVFFIIVFRGFLKVNCSTATSVLATQNAETDLTLSETNIWPLKIDVWKINFRFVEGAPWRVRTVRFGECKTGIIKCHPFRGIKQCICMVI